MINVFQIELTTEQRVQVNASGWDGVEWGKTYLDLTNAMFEDSDNVSVMEMIVEAIEFGIVKHTMTMSTDNFDTVFILGNNQPLPGPEGHTCVTHHVPHKSVSVGDIFIRNHTDGVVVAGFGFEELSNAEIKEIETLVPQAMGMVKDV
jgi:hypothetical protein